MEYNNNNSNEKECKKKRKGVERGKKKPSDAQCNCSPPADRHPVSSRAAIHASRPTPPCLYTGHDVPWYGIALWLVQVSCPGYAPSQLLAHLLAGRARETEKSLV